MSVSLLVPILVAALAVLVLLADLAPGVDTSGATPEAKDSRRGIGVLTAVGLAGILCAAWFVPTSEAMDGRWVADAFTRYAQMVVLAAGALGAVGTIDHADSRFPGRQGEYYLLYLSSIFGMVLLPGARDVVLLLVAFETMSIPLYALSAMHKDQKLGIEGAIKLYLSGAVSAAVTIYGLSFLVGAAGGTTYAEIAAVTPSPLLALGAVLALAGMAYKLGAVPFHFWVADTYQAAPGPLVAFLSVAPKAAVLAGLMRVLTEALDPLRASWAALLLALALVSMGLGNLSAIPQNNIRRLLAFSGIAHIGLLLLALSVNTAESTAMILFYLATYVASNMAAILVVEAIGSQIGDEIPAWAGLARRNPAISLVFLLSLLSLGGIPFVAGFWGKFLLFWSIWRAGGEVWVLVGALLAVLALFYYLRVARSVYIEAPKDATRLKIGLPTGIALGIAVAGIVGMGLYPTPFVNAALDAGVALVGGK